MTRTVVVTGGGTGIGRAIAIRLAQQGDAVVVTGRRPEPLAETVRLAGDRARPVVCDGTDPLQVEEFAAGLDGPVEALVNNAGGNTEFDNPEPASLADLAASWRRNFDANVVTALLMTEALENRLADNAKVISIGSIAAERFAGSYGAAKAALAAWNLTTARHLGARGITCNVVAPGYIEDTEFFRDRSGPEHRATQIGQTFVGRPGTPADIAETVAFLASAEARHITGQVVHVNGGQFVTR